MKGFPQRCPECGGKGIILTEDGKAILELLEVVESHSPVTDGQVQEAIEKDQAERQERERQREEQRKAEEEREKKIRKALEKAGVDPDTVQW
jgi:DNA-binding protein H-NS